MATRKEVLERTLAHFTYQRAQAKELLEEFEKGQHEYGAMIEGRKVDQSAEMIGTLKRQIETCNKVIPAYERLLADL